MNYKMIPVFKGGVTSLVPAPIEPVVAPQPGVRPNGRTKKKKPETYFCNKYFTAKGLVPYGFMCSTLIDPELINLPTVRPLSTSDIGSRSL